MPKNAPRSAGEAIEQVVLAIKCSVFSVQRSVFSRLPTTRQNWYPRKNLRHHQDCWSPKKSKIPFFRHPGEGRDPVISSLRRISGFRPSPGWRLFTMLSRLID